MRYGLGDGSKRPSGYRFEDFFLFTDAYGKKATDVYAKFDLDGDGEIGLNDFFLFADRFGRKAQ